LCGVCQHLFYGTLVTYPRKASGENPTKHIFRGKGRKEERVFMELVSKKASRKDLGEVE